jgi:hypothetical protein
MLGDNLLQALDALTRSTASLIVAEAPFGLVTIFYQTRSENTPEAFHVRFIPCDTHGHFNGGGTVMVGSYQDLNTSLNVAASVYGVGEDGWEPTSVEDLRLVAPFSHGPRIEARRISQEDETQPA